MDEETEHAVANVIARAWSDPSFKERLRTDTRAACVECGLNYPENVEVVFLEDTPTKRYVVLPQKPADENLGVQFVGGVAAVGSSSGTCRCFEASV